MSDKLTAAQRRVVQHVADNSGKLYGAHRDFPSSVGREDVIRRAWFAGWIDPPAKTATRTWEVTDAGRRALTNEPKP